MQLPEYDCQFSCQRKSAAQREVWRVVSPSSGSSWQIMLHIYLYACLEPLLNCQCCLKFWGCGYSYTLERILFLGLGLAVTEINTKKV